MPHESQRFFDCQPSQVGQDGTSDPTQGHTLQTRIHKVKTTVVELYYMRVFQQNKTKTTLVYLYVPFIIARICRPFQRFFLTSHQHTSKPSLQPLAPREPRCVGF